MLCLLNDWFAGIDWHFIDSNLFLYEILLVLYDFDLIINSTSITKLNEVSVDYSSILLVTKIFKLISNRISWLIY